MGIDILMLVKTISLTRSTVYDLLSILSGYNCCSCMV